MLTKDLQVGDSLRIGETRLRIDSITGQTVEFSIDAPPHISVRCSNDSESYSKELLDQT